MGAQRDTASPWSVWEGGVGRMEEDCRERVVLCSEDERVALAAAVTWV